ncbi:Pilus assembly protein PilP [mine drainage metagenome]|uniref:Pilus assembly protein PilP n=1 Tax=mine drainage metagenome TaxID=410659 RepID=T1C328_9ZZZZ
MNHSRHRTFKALVLLATASLALAGCSNQNRHLRAWVKKIETRQPSPLAPIPKLPPYHPYRFKDANLRSPFVPTIATVPGNAIPNPNRPRQYLERFPLDSLSMVGTMEMRGKRYALIKDPNGLIHRVTYGNYIGQNDGKIISISPAEIGLREIVPNGTGGWVVEKAYLPLSLASGGH